MTILNQGSGNAGSSTTKVQIKAQGSTTTTVENTFATPAISAGSSTSQSYSLTILIGTAAGNSTVDIIFNNGNVLGQINVNNDYAQFNFTVQGVVLQPD